DVATGFALGALVLERKFQAIAQTVQRGAQVVGDVVRNLADAVKQALDAVEHAIEMAGEIVELVARPRHRNPARKVTGDDFAADAIDDVEPGKKAPADEDAADDAEPDH